MLHPLQVSDVVMIEKDQRIPADLVFLRTSEKNGIYYASFGNVECLEVVTNAVRNT